jgi:FMN phosphatase YigB (HAD superfamily)
MTPVSAVVFDLDGTLYRQKPVQRAMLAKLVWSTLSDPVQGMERIQILWAYRRAQELLRHHPHSAAGVAAAQVRITAERCGVGTRQVSAVVEEWMQQKPLALLVPAMRPGTVEIFSRLQSAGVRLGLLSDYPAEAKLRAMGIAGWFDVVACAQEKEINRFKPDPRGLEVVLERLGVDAGQALYVGDRDEVDGEAARRAGVDVVILQTADWSRLETRLALRGMAKPVESIPDSRPGTRPETAHSGQILPG